MMKNTTNNDSQYISSHLQRAFKVIDIMVGHEVLGITPGTLAKLANTAPANITRLLDNLALANLAERLPNNPTRWRLTAKFAQYSNSISLNLNQAQLQLQQDQQNYSLLAV
ncbi:hypothetical protein HWQ46_03150 [Shewanella sp. D64]|uniref:hypothetical protein n=1 Tax=unclassified Shewanella TaxID=196818 RepID=UPI0022BA5F7C|nr:MULTISPECIES: hypothetical protein [unclassified Shewanella]MEC4724544.1 hypothetical protein [Shewanella sp. D64]MEC4736679.1 hypothetical protein [Shewanella sp. E94]WBJ94651.1 hypothetical protein HWQ47_22790 [Shewanella sp. MTB7]